MSDKEKRRTRRKFLPGVLEFYDEAGVMMVGVGRLVDLSVSGALVESPVKLATDEVVRIRLRLENKEPLEMMAKVARVVGKRSQLAYGLQFGDLSSIQLARIQSLL